jgi:hypothetical protein
MCGLTFIVQARYQDGPVVRMASDGHDISSPTNASSSHDPGHSSAETSRVTVEVQTVTIYTSTDGQGSLTIGGSIPTVPTSYLAEPVTRTLDNTRLLTGTCTQTYFADITDRAGQVLRYPQMGCALSAQNCCPYPYLANVLLANCPIDYQVQVRGTYRACCPS